MMSNNIARRSFLTGAAALFCTPAIVKASSLMKIKPEKLFLLTITVDAKGMQDYLDSVARLQHAMQIALYDTLRVQSRYLIGDVPLNEAMQKAVIDTIEVNILHPAPQITIHPKHGRLEAVISCPEITVRQ